jgi:hypothetical protein
VHHGRDGFGRGLFRGARRVALRPASEAPARASVAGRRDHRLFRLGQDDPAPVLQTFATHRAFDCELHLRALICVVDEANFERMQEARKQVALAEYRGPGGRALRPACRPPACRTRRLDRRRRPAVASALCHSRSRTANRWCSSSPQSPPSPQPAPSRLGYVGAAPVGFLYTSQRRRRSRSQSRR